MGQIKKKKRFHGRSQLKLINKIGLKSRPPRLHNLINKYNPTRTKQLILRPMLEVGQWLCYVGFNATVGQIDQLNIV